MRRPSAGNRIPTLGCCSGEGHKFPPPGTAPGPVAPLQAGLAFPPGSGFPAPLSYPLGTQRHQPPSQQPCPAASCCTASASSSSSSPPAPPQPSTRGFAGHAHPPPPPALTPARQAGPGRAAGPALLRARRGAQAALPPPWLSGRGPLTVTWAGPRYQPPPPPSPRPPPPTLGPGGDEARCPYAAPRRPWGSHLALPLLPPPPGPALPGHRKDPAAAGGRSSRRRRRRRRREEEEEEEEEGGREGRNLLRRRPHGREEEAGGGSAASAAGTGAEKGGGEGWRGVERAGSGLGVGRGSLASREGPSRAGARAGRRRQDKGLAGGPGGQEHIRAQRSTWQHREACLCLALAGGGATWQRPAVRSLPGADRRENSRDRPIEGHSESVLLTWPHPFVFHTQHRGVSLAPATIDYQEQLPASQELK
ncbi:hypothetical protein DV515_00014432, partial [Chloebia gouldiae]